MRTDGSAEPPIAAALAESDAGAVISAIAARGETALVIDPARILAVCRRLKQEHGFQRLSGITAVDRFPAEPRFEVIYQLHSIERNQRLRCKCLLPGANPVIGSVTSVWRCADWYEREVFDLFGVRFTGHPNLKRILMPDDWEGHPLRKDFPVHGHKYSYGEEE